MEADINIRLSKETHILVRALADLWGLNASDALKLLITEKAPEVVNAVAVREERQQKIGRSKSRSNKQDNAK